MIRQYEKTTEEWERISPLLPPERNGKKGRPGKDNRTMLNGMVWILELTPSGEHCRNAMVRGKVYTQDFVSGVTKVC